MSLELVVCCCTRGLVHSRTVEAIINNIIFTPFESLALDKVWDLTFTHNYSIPYAQNEITERALADHPRWIWYVEEDIVPPMNALRNMLLQGREHEVVSAKYNNRTGGGACHSLSDDGQLLYTGMGCLLVKADVFRRLERPWFRTDRQYYVDRQGNWRMLTKEETSYGGQDLHFFASLHAAGIKPRLTNVECQHLNVKKYNTERVNNGVHEIEAV